MGPTVNTLASEGTCPSLVTGTAPRLLSRCPLLAFCLRKWKSEGKCAP